MEKAKKTKPNLPLGEITPKDLIIQIMDKDDSWEFIKMEVLKNPHRFTQRDKEILFLKIENNHWKREPKEYEELIKSLGPIKKSLLEIDTHVEFVTHPDVFIPDTKGIEYTVGSLNMLQNFRESPGHILDYISHNVGVKLKGKCHFLRFDNSRDAWKEFPGLGESNDEWEQTLSEHRSSWNQLYCGSTPHKEPVVSSDHHHYFYPYYDGDNFHGLSVVRMEKPLDPTEIKEMDLMLECARCIFLDKKFCNTLLSITGPTQLPQGKKEFFLKRFNRFLDYLKKGLGIK